MVAIVVVVVLVVGPVAVQIIVRVIPDQAVIGGVVVRVRRNNGVHLRLIRIVQIRSLGVHCIERNHVSRFEVIVCGGQIIVVYVQRAAF